MEISEPEDLKKRVRECVEDFAETVAEEQDYVPKLRIASGEQFDREEKIVDQPSRIITLYSSRQEEFFEDTAEWLYESGNGYPLKEPERESEDEVTYLGAPDDFEFSEGPNLFQYVNPLFNFAGTVMDYSGGYSVTDEGFEAAYESHWLPKYETGLDSFEVIIPLYFFNIPDGGELKLSADFELRRRRRNYYRIESLRISPITEVERRGIHSFRAGGGEAFSRNPVDAAEYKIHADIKERVESQSFYYPGEEIAERLATGLRLYNPCNDAGDLTVGSSYRWEPNWLEFREGIPDFEYVSDTQVDRYRDQQQEAYFLSSKDRTAFADFWERHCHRIRIDKDGEFTRSIQRFNEIWSKRFFEDQLLDCLIGLEGLLLQGTGPSSSVTLRLKLRGGQLLDGHLPYDREYIQNFLQDIYTMRGDIVHENKYLADALEQNSGLKVVNERFDHPKDVVTEARYFVSKTISAYMELSEKTGLSMTEIGQNMDEAALDVDSSDLFD